MQGKFEEACEQWRGVVEADEACLPARLNFGLIRAEMSCRRARKFEARNSKSEWGSNEIRRARCRNPKGASRAVRVAVLSLLFNWPSTGGGNMHTAGLVDFLGRDGFDVRHFYAQYEPWGIGRGTRDDLVASEAIEFAETEWNVPTIRERFRAAVDSFAPDYVVISDTWNMKPHLAEAMRGYPTILLMQAQECLCPLNNLRLLGIGPVKAEQCPRNQLATPQVCHQCLAERGQHSGALHQVERALAGVGTPEYDALMRQMSKTPRPCSCSIRSPPHSSSHSPVVFASSRGASIRRDFRGPPTGKIPSLRPASTPLLLSGAMSPASRTASLPSPNRGEIIQPGM